MTTTSQFADMMILLSKFFWWCFVSLIKFSYWSKFYVNIITGSGVMTIFFYKGLTRNHKIRNTRVWVLPSILRLGQVRDTKFGTNVSNEMLLNAAKCYCYNFYCFELLRDNQSYHYDPHPDKSKLSVNRT